MDEMLAALDKIHLEAGKPALSEHERLIARSAYSFGFKDGTANVFNKMAELRGGSNVR